MTTPHVNLAAPRRRDEALGPAPGKLALHQLCVKYKSYGTPSIDEQEKHVKLKRQPSELVREKLDLPIPYRDGKLRIKPEIIERHNFFNLPYQVDHHLIPLVSEVPSTVSIDEPLFQPFPPQITFVGYKAFQKYHAILQLRNNDKLVRRVMVIPLVSDVLTVQPYSHPDLETLTIYDELGVSKVACGMEFSVIVNFCPPSQDDFESEVVVVTEREKFVVPVIGHGLRGVLDLADEIVFPPTPVQFNYKKNVMLHNKGTKYANWQVKVYTEDEEGKEGKDLETFLVQPEYGKLEPGEFVELELEFKPLQVGVVQGELKLTYTDTAQDVYSKLTGIGIELDVGLSTDDLTMHPTNIHTSSQRSIFISNLSTSVAVFQFEKFATEYDEGSLEHGYEPKALKWAQVAANESTMDQNEDGVAPRQERIFTLNPAKGDLWPGNRLDIVVTFNPQQAKRYFTIAYCTISGKQDRIPLRIDGQGIGPLAQFFPTRVELKEVNLFSQYDFDVKLQNTGELEARYELQSSESEKPGTKFRFSPEKGTIAVGEFNVIHVSVYLNTKGPFEESFVWYIDESVNYAPLFFRSEVIQPAVDVEPRLLDYGLVSFGFDCLKEFKIMNRSHIPLNFTFPMSELEVTWKCHMHGNTKHEKPPLMCHSHGRVSDFTVTPYQTIVQPKETVTIVVKLVPREERLYDALMGVLIEELDNEAFCEIKLKARCCIPKVSLPYDELDFGDSYIRFMYKKPLELLNESNVPAKYKIMPLSVDNRTQAEITSTPIEGIVDAFSLRTIYIEFTAQKLGNISIEFNISISGKDPCLLTVKVTGYGIGPKLRFAIPYPREHDQKVSTESTALSFGQVKILEHHTMDLEVTNISLIPAVFTVQIQDQEDPVFSLDKSEVTLEPHQMMLLQVGAYLDDTLKFESVIKFTLEGGGYDISCSAIGFGAVLLCKEFEAGVIDFGEVLTDAVLSLALKVQNLGRRPQTVEVESLTHSGKMYFSVRPTAAPYLEKNATQSFLLSGVEKEACTIEECFQWTSNVIRSKAKPETHRVVVKANVSVLALIFSSSTLRFIQINGPGFEEADETVQPLTCQNVFKLPLQFSFNCKLPYRLSLANEMEHVLQPLETLTLAVILDWQRPEDKLSHVFNNKLEVVYRDTTRKENINLIAEIHFPNLKIDTTAIDFGVEVFRDPTAATAEFDDRDEYDGEGTGLRGRIRITTRCMWTDGGRLVEHLRQSVESALASCYLDYTLPQVERKIGTALKKAAQKFINRRPEVIVMATEASVGAVPPPPTTTKVSPPPATSHNKFGKFVPEKTVTVKSSSTAKAKDSTKVETLSTTVTVSSPADFFQEDQVEPGFTC